MDPIDDFEFKPITEGLGFHKKSPLQLEPELPAPIEPARRPELKEILPPFRSQQDFIKDKPVVKPTPRTEPKLYPPMPHAPPPKLDTRVKIEPVSQIVSTYAEPKLNAVALNLPAVLIDAVMIFALSILFLVAVLVVTKVDLVSVMTNAQNDGMTQLSLLLLVVAVVQLYMITLRSFFGSTLGEWAFDSQLGTAAQQMSVLFPLLVLWRSIFITITGLFPLPILSLLFGRDLAAYATGLNLYARRD